jgi:hypothetical protein
MNSKQKILTYLLLLFAPISSWAQFCPEYNDLKLSCRLSGQNVTDQTHESLLATQPGDARYQKITVHFRLS